ncbi:hypothetical protein Tsp_12378, partial [Trichinella spiralis]|uniref:hypothetical protein n=1 Tax=Trichinella spiralis TaxID=6334 RepID=UPI0001EFDC3E
MGQIEKKNARLARVSTVQVEQFSLSLQLAEPAGHPDRRSVCCASRLNRADHWLALIGRCWCRLDKASLDKVVLYQQPPDEPPISGTQIDPTLLFVISVAASSSLCTIYFYLLALQKQTESISTCRCLPPGVIPNRLVQIQKLIIPPEPDMILRLLIQSQRPRKESHARLEQRPGHAAGSGAPGSPPSKTFQNRNPTPGAQLHRRVDAHLAQQQAAVEFRIRLHPVQG